MVFKACGFDPKGAAGKMISRAAWWLIQKNVKNAEALGKAA